MASFNYVVQSGNAPTVGELYKFMEHLRVVHNSLGFTNALTVTSSGIACKACEFIITRE